MSSPVRQCLTLRFLAGVFTLVLASVVHAGVKLPPTPPWAAATPINLGAAGSQPVTYGGTVFRIPFSSKIGAAYRIGHEEPLKELRWEVQPGRSREFDVQTNDRLRLLGYKVIDPTTLAFESENDEKSRFRLGAIVTGIQQNFYIKTGNYQVTDQSYGVAELDVEFQLQDAESEQVIFKKAVRGYGIEQAKDPRPIVVAMMNALEHFLAESELVAKLRVADTTVSASASVLPPLRISQCLVGDGRKMPAALDAVNKAVVVIKVGAVRGSGAMISADGWALTAAHLVSGRSSVSVLLPGGLELDAVVSRVDKSTDVALLRLPGRGYPCMALGKTAPAIGTDLFVIGAPLGQSFANSVTRGVVSARREVDGLSVLQTDASINPGNSGGPMLDTAANILAIVSFKTSAPHVEGMAFGIPVDVAVRGLALVIE